MTKISFNQIDKYMAWCKENNKLETVVSMGEGDDKFDVVIRKYISLDEQTELIGTVFNELFAQGGYNAYAYKVLFNTALLTYFTNIKTTAVTSDRLMFLIYETDIITKIQNFCTQVFDIEDTLYDLIKDRKQELDNNYKAEYEKLRDQLLTEQEQIIEQLEALIKVYSNISDGLEGVDMAALLKDINKIANADDRERVRNVLEVKRDNGELGRETE